MEMLVIFVLALMLFGGKRLPEVAKGLGKSVREFRKAASGVEDEIRKAMDLDDRPAHRRPARRPRPAAPKNPGETPLPENRPTPTSSSAPTAASAAATAAAVAKGAEHSETEPSGPTADSPPQTDPETKPADDKN